MTEEIKNKAFDYFERDVYKRQVLYHEAVRGNLNAVIHEKL